MWQYCKFIKKKKMHKYIRSFWKSYGVRLSLYSLAIVSIPPPLATAIKHDWLPTSNPTTDISYITFGKRIQLVFQVIHKLLPSTCQYLTFLSNMADKEEKFWEPVCSASTRKKTSSSQWLKISFFPIKFPSIKSLNFLPYFATCFYQNFYIELHIN